MLTKSKRSALILGGITVLAFSLTSALVNIAIPYWVSGDIHTVVANPESLAIPGSLAALIVVVILLLLLLSGLAAYWIYRFFGDGYYGKRGALRWALFGLLLAMLLQIPIWIFPERIGFLKLPWQIASVFLAFFGSRGIIKIIKDSPRNENQ
jgi:uncharacterized membrane-anchored protein